MSKLVQVMFSPSSNVCEYFFIFILLEPFECFLKYTNILQQHFQKKLKNWPKKKDVLWQWPKEKGNTGKAWWG